MNKIIILPVILFVIIVILAGVLIFLPKAENNPVVLDDSKSFPESEAGVILANNQFAFDLYKKYEANDGNIFFSPYSLSTALAMVYEGAKGKTAEEIQAVFHFPKDAGVRQPAFAKIYNQINKAGKTYELKTANALWAQKDFAFLDSYFSLIKNYYGGEVTNLDFINAAEDARLTINKWVEDQTNDKIKDLIPAGVLSNLTKLVLTNAIYFKGTWQLQFDKKDTKEQDFNIASDKTVKAQMMSLKGEDAKFNYAENSDLQILELPYDSKDLSMLVLLPKNNISSVDAYLTPEKFLELKAGLTEKQVNVYFPKFKIETKYSMKGDLSNMGMPVAFSDQADFSGMDGKQDLRISEVIHQAFVEVNEEGTEAAAATAVIMELKSAFPSDQLEFIADHPFIFLIQDNATGNILFLGRVSNPS